MSEDAPQTRRAEEAEARNRLVELGRFIREQRTGRFTVQELAERADVSAGLISQIERGQGNPSFLTLYKLATALGLRVGDLLEAGDGTSSSGMVVRKDRRKRLQVGGEDGLVYELLTPDLRRTLEVLRTQVPAGFSNEEHPFAHQGEECVHLLRGRLEVSVGGRFFTLEQGDSITYDSGSEHWWHNPTKKEAVIVGAVTPPTF